MDHSGPEETDGMMTEGCAAVLSDLAVLQPEKLQRTVGRMQPGRQQPGSRILQLVVAQVQISQTGGIGAQSGGQSRTASISEKTTPQPQSFQSAVWTPQSWNQLMDSCVLQSVVAQVQISEAGGCGGQRRGQRWTACLCQVTANQSGITSQSSQIGRAHV